MRARAEEHRSSATVASLGYSAGWVIVVKRRTRNAKYVRDVGLVQQGRREYAWSGAVTPVQSCSDISPAETAGPTKIGLGSLLRTED